MKIITLCGSLKFKKEMMETAEKMALEGNCILTPVYPVLENYERTDEQLKKLKEEHFKRIELADAILVVNVNNYIGDSTNLEIEYAKKLQEITKAKAAVVIDANDIGVNVLGKSDKKLNNKINKIIFIVTVLPPLTASLMYRCDHNILRSDLCLSRHNIFDLRPVSVS